MFLKFHTAEERRRYGGSAFVEIQYCRLKQGTSIQKIISVDSISAWDISSIYIDFDDLDEFWNEYGGMFQNGVYNNGQEGPTDFYGINYYDLSNVHHLIRELEIKKPKEYEILLAWLKNGRDENGIYILGI